MVTFMYNICIRNRYFFCSNLFEYCAEFTNPVLKCAKRTSHTSIVLLNIYTHGPILLQLTRQVPRMYLLLHGRSQGKSYQTSNRNLEFNNILSKLILSTENYLFSSIKNCLFSLIINDLLFLVKFFHQFPDSLQFSP